MRWNRATAFVAGLFAAGIAIRIALQLPLHRWANEGDCVVIGFGAWEILAGDLRIFVSTGYRQGALSCYLAAAATLFVGPGRAALALQVCIVGIGQMAVWWLALLELTGWSARSAASGRLLAFIVLPSSAVLYWGVYWPNGYPDIFLAAMLVLWAGARFWRRGGAGNLFALATACGFAFWMSMVTFTVTIPMLAWLLWQRGRELAAPRRLLTAVAGAILGALPWFVFNVRYDWASLRSNWAVRPATGAAAAVDNAARYFGEVLPGLFAALTQTGAAEIPTGGPRVLQLIAAALFIVTVIILGWAIYRSPRAADPRSVSSAQLPAVENLPPLVALAAGVFATSAILFIFSAAGSMPGNVTRYALPIYLVWPLLFALAWEVAERRARGVLTALAVTVLCGYAYAVPWPWKAERIDLRAALEVERSMVQRLEAKGVEAVFGSFWEVYPIIFESGGRLGGSTLEPDFDFHRFADRLPAGVCRWAFLGRGGGRRQIAAQLGVRGEVESFGSARWFLLPAANAAESPEKATCSAILSRVRSGTLR